MKPISGVLSASGQSLGFILEIGHYLLHPEFAVRRPPYPLDHKARNLQVRDTKREPGAKSLDKLNIWFLD